MVVPPPAALSDALSAARCAAVVLALGLLLAAVPAAEAQTQVGEVTDLTGPAVALQGDRPRTLRRGAPVHAEDRLRTYARAKLEVAFRDGGVLRLGPDSVVEVARYAAADGRGTLQLIRGALRMAIERLSGWTGFEVRTAHAVASARSTEWVVVADTDGTAVFVVDGRVGVAAQGRTVELGPGEGTDVPAGGPPGAVKRWGQARVDAVLARTTLR
jgi:hypothetical protein